MSARSGEPARQQRARSVLAAAVLLLALVASAAWARPLTDQEKAALASTVASFDAAMRQGDHARVVQTVPPKVLAAIARYAKTTPEAVIAAMVRAMQSLESGDVRIESFEMDLAAAIHKEHPSGTPYLLIPTHTTVAVSGKRVRERGHTLALLDGGKWHLLRVKDDRQLGILREVYPEFAGVEFPRGSTELLNQ